ncbi:unconventional myosin-XVIIIa-like isoform X2 [Ornithodoros turicata]|uniref:unconventional myosin-XVIIIa-like isoform X2 n=1 Tax=Ornithodoros turicata TaxID=34597 RepID=UPI003139049D
MFPWKKAKEKEKDDKGKRREEKKAQGKSAGSDTRRRNLVISAPIQTQFGSSLTSPIAEEHVAGGSNSQASSHEQGVTAPFNGVTKKPPPVPPKKFGVARTLSAPKSKPPERPTPRSATLMVQSSSRSPSGKVQEEKKRAKLNLVLPSVKTDAHCLPPRVLTVVRQPTGDFGFSLRRSALSDGIPGSDVRPKTIMFAEPSTVASSVSTGLLPGDRLLEVNGVSVEDMSREGVIDLVRASGDKVALKVQPLPELCEIVSRVAQGSSVTGFSRTLSRVSSRRCKVLGAKTDEEIAAERQWIKSVKVWVMFDGGYASASLVKSDSKPLEGKVKVRLDASGEIVEVDEEDVEKANPPHLDFVEDLSQLRHLNEASVLHVLRSRFSANLTHTYAGSDMVVFNSLQPLAIYSEKVMRLFKSCRPDDLPPHIFAVAQSAYASLLATRRDQSIVLLGRSGSGKSCNAKQVVQHLCTTTGGANSTAFAEKLSATSVLLESFGNCRTAANTNASRFTQLFSFDFDHSGQMVSSSVQTFMLERSRVSRRPDGEPNFHIFYYMLAGMSDPLRKEMCIESLEEPNHFLTPLRKPEDKRKATVMWDLILASLQTLSVKEQESKSIWAILAAIYHLGTASASRGPNGRLTFARPQSAQKAAVLLGTSVEDLAKAVFSHDSLLSASGNSRLASRNAQNESPTEPLEPLQAFVMALYSEAFSALVGLINRALATPGRNIATIHILDAPGFQFPLPSSSSHRTGATLEDLCHNYAQERLQLLFHDSTFRAQQERYDQEGVTLDVDEFQTSLPSSMVSLLDQCPPQQGSLRASTTDLRISDQCGLLYVLDEESLYPGNVDEAFLDKVFQLCDSQEHQELIRRGQLPTQFALNHLHGTLPITYNASGWLKIGREHAAFRQVASLLQDTQKEHMSQMFASARGLLSTCMSSSTLNLDCGTSSLRRIPSIRRAQSAISATAKRRSLPLQVKYAMDALVDVLRRTRLHFVHCFVPNHGAGLCNHHPASGTSLGADNQFDVPLVRSQLHGTKILDAVRIRKQGFPENMLYIEFKRRYEVLAPAESRGAIQEIVDGKASVEALLQHLDIDATTYRLGLSQIFLRSGTLSTLESQRDEKLASVVIRFQAHVRGYLGRRRYQKLKVQVLAIRCIQRNVKKFLEVRNWTWWRLFTKLAPLLNVHRTEEELRMKMEETEVLKVKLEKLEKERAELKLNHDNLEAKVSELWSDLSQEQAASVQAAEMLDAESAERMRLEKEVRELQSRCSQLQQQKDRIEMEVSETRMMRSFSTEANGDISDDDDINGVSIYKQKYERVLRETEMKKRKMSQQHEDEVEQLMMSRKAAEKKLAEALDDVEEGRQAVSSWKRKAQKLTAELQDLQLMVEEHMGRNAELERKQRKFDGELSSAVDNLKQERYSKEKILREKEALYAEKLALEQELQAVRMELEMQHSKVSSLHKELDELTFSSHGEEEVAKLKRAKQELDRKARDQEEELEDLAGQVQLLEQSKLRLEMALEKQRQEHRREVSTKEEELDEARAAAAKKLRNLEALLEQEQEDRHALGRQKNELERRLAELSERPPPRDPEIERRLRRDLRRTRALLRDAQGMLEHARDGQATKTIVRQLKNQLEDAEFAKTVAVKARQGAEMELQEVQTQLEEVLRVKNESEGRCLQLNREKGALQIQLEEIEEEQAELMKKYKAAVQQMATDQKVISEQSEQIVDLESERHHLREQVHDLSSKVEHMSSQAEESHVIRRLESRVRDLESKLELEQTSKSRLEGQVQRLKDQCNRLQDECSQAITKEQQTQENCRKLQRQLRDLREDCTALQHKEAEAQQRCHELEMALDNAETDLQGTRNDLKLACQRIQDLQTALEEDLDSGTDILEESESDEDDDDVDVDSILKKHGLSAIGAKTPGYSLGGDDSPINSRRNSNSAAFSLNPMRALSLDYPL